MAPARAAPLTTGMAQACLARELGLDFDPGFLRERRFYLALLAAPCALLLLDRLMPGWRAGRAIPAEMAVTLVLWAPLLEELLFRGVIQGQLARHTRFRLSLAGVSLANLATSLLFGLAHLFHHSPSWAIAVILPSLVFGHFRDRHGLYPALLLHAAYNGCYAWMESAPGMAP